MQQFSYSQLDSLINDPELTVQEQALSLLRNLACGKEADIEATLHGLGSTRLFELIDAKLDSQAEEIISQVPPT
jgi:hypothetical protein